MMNMDLCKLKAQFAAFRAKQNLKSFMNDSQDYMKHKPMKCMLMALAAGVVIHKLMCRK